MRYQTLEDRMLRDKIIIGIIDDKLRERLVSDDKLDLNATLTMCRTSKITSKQLQVLKGENSINAVRKQASSAYPKQEETKKNQEPKSEEFYCTRCDTTHGLWHQM